MNWGGMKGRLSKPAAALSEWFAAPLHLAQLSPLSGMVLVFLLATTLGAALFAAYAFFGPKGTEAAVSAPDWTPPTLAVVELDPPKPPSADVETLSRPIFSKSRRPSPKTAKPTDSASAADIPAATGLTINAIIKNKKVSQAFFVSPEAPEGSWKKVGDTVDSWTIKAIHRDEVILANAGRTVKVQIYPDAPQPEQAQAPGSTPPAPAFSGAPPLPAAPPAPAAPPVSAPPPPARPPD